MNWVRPKVPRPKPPPDYEEWLRQYGQIDELALRRKLRESRDQPLISILMPVYNPNLSLLMAAIDSVRGQIYEPWELCMADDASSDPELRSQLQKLATADGRIKIDFRPKNGGIAACSNSALTLATGEWCALLDQDDLLAADALACVVLEMSKHPEARLIYSDEDKVDAEGKRHSPYFKTDWDPELFLGQNYINHLGVYNTRVIREIGGFREGFEGSQDHDLALRFIETLTSDQVRHIPRVLYHWRAVPGSVAAAIDAKPHAKEAARRAITEHLERRAIAAHVEACQENPERHRVVYELPDRLPLVSVIIPTRDRVDLLKRCLEGIRHRTNYDPIELIVVDNGSVEQSSRDFLAQLAQENHTQVITESGSFNFSRLINRGAAAANGQLLVLLNDDTEVEEPDWLREMVSLALQPGAGAVGARLWYPDGTLQHGGVVLGLGGLAGHPFAGSPRGFPGYFDNLLLQRSCSAVTAACMAVRTSVFREAAAFDEKEFPISFNDVDFCLRLRQRGLRNIWTPSANLIHNESASRRKTRAGEAEAQFMKDAAALWQKWSSQLLADPHYNPNLSLDLPGYELAFPPREPVDAPPALDAPSRLDSIPTIHLPAISNGEHNPGSEPAGVGTAAKRTPKFSIIVVDCETHTPRESARRGIDSILAQSFSDFEVILLHDGLKEKPYKEEFDLSRFERLKIVYTSERHNDWGHSLRDYGLRIADGEYVLHFNIDNQLYPHCLQRVNERLLRDNIRKEIIIFSIIHHKNAERILTGNPVEFQHIDCLQVVASRRAWQSIGFWHRNEYEADGYLYLELAAKYKPYYIDEILAENF
jgi:GT2 family glycosyltransferase